MTSPERLTLLVAAATTPAITDRYFAKIVRPASSSCWWWTGAITGRGHGRFWIEPGVVVVAHRFGWLINAGAADELPAVVRHACDNPLCQNPAHLLAGSWSENRQDYLARSGVPGSALNDVRGSAERARALREALRSGDDLDRAFDVGLSPLDRLQSTLW